MRHQSSRARGRVRRLTLSTLFVLGIALLSLGVAGCASEQPSLTVTSLANRQAYEPQFTHAYAARNARGVDVVLAAEHHVAGDAKGATATPASPAASAVAAANPASLRQIMHIRVLWSPDHPMKVDGPASTNASIRWYVFTGEGRDARMIEYTGTGMVMLDPDDAETKVVIRNASLSPVLKQGALNDPIGAAKFEGKLVARNSRQKVSDLLSEVKATLASATVSRAAADHTTALPVGP